MVTQNVVKALVVLTLILIYIKYFGIQSLKRYLSEEITVNRNYKTLPDIKPPGLLELIRENPFFNFLMKMSY